MTSNVNNSVLNWFVNKFMPNNESDINITNELNPAWWWTDRYSPNDNDFDHDYSLNECQHPVRVVNFVENYYLIPYFLFCFLAVLMILIGFKHVRVSNFFIPAIYTGTLAYIIFSYHFLDHSLMYRSLSSVAIGLVIAILSCGVFIIGNLMLCFFSGAIIGLFLAFAIRFAVTFPYIWIGAVILSGCGVISVIGGSFNSAAYRVFALFNCCAFIILATVDYTMNDRALTRFAFQVMTSTVILDPPCWYSWVYLLGWVIPIIIGYVFMGMFNAITNSRNKYQSRHKRNVKYFQNLLSDNNHESKIL